MNKLPDNLILEDERVRLQPLQEDDLPHLLPFAMHETDIWQFGLVIPAGEEGMKSYIHETVEQRKAGKEYPFIVYDKLTGTYAGSTRFYDIQYSYDTTQLGYTWYGKAFQRTGLNRHCKLLLLSYAFEIWKLERVEFRADIHNHASVNAMKAIGCTVEGVLRKSVPLARGGRRDTIVLSILKEEWFGGVKDALLKKTK